MENYGGHEEPKTKSGLKAKGQLQTKSGFFLDIMTPSPHPTGRYNVTAVATPYLLRRIGEIFPRTTLPVVGNDFAENFTSISLDQFEAMTDEERQNGRWKIGYYLHRIRLFWHFREALQEEFRFR